MVVPRIKRHEMEPITASVDVTIEISTLWKIFTNVRRWSQWNPCMAGARLVGDPTKSALLIWAFKVHHWWLGYRMPVVATIVEWVPEKRVTWENDVLGLHVVHTYFMEDIGEGRSRFGSWEQAEGPTFRMMRHFWLAHFQMVCDESLRGVKKLENKEVRENFLQLSN